MTETVGKIAIKKNAFGAGFSVKPITYLGGDHFGTYRAACDGARFDRARKQQVVDAVEVLEGVVARLTQAGFEVALDADVEHALTERAQKVVSLVSTAEARMDAMDKMLAARGLSLYPFQRIGVRWLVSRRSGLLADDMGLGKTVELLASLPDAKDCGVLIVCPRVVKGNWKLESNKWRPDFTVTILEGKSSFRFPERGEIVIVNYDIIPAADEKEIVDTKTNFKMIEYNLAPDVSKPKCMVRLVLDEAHFLKSSKAKRTKACRALAGVCDGTLVMTATPLVNKPPELYSVLALGNMVKEAFGSYKVFADLMGAKKVQVTADKFVTEWGEPRNPQEIGERLSRVMLRRLKTEVLPDLPTKTYKTIEVPISPRATKACDKLLEVLKKDGFDLFKIQDIGELPFDRFSEVRAALADAKLPSLLEMVEDYEEQEEPLVIFSAHQAPLDAVGKREGWGVLHGGVSQKVREELVVAFQAGKLKGLACGIKSAGVGITLHRASHEIFLDKAWTPSDNLQAEDRLLRIGQTRGVLVTSLVADHALERHIYTLLGEKVLLNDQTVEQGRRRRDGL